MLKQYPVIAIHIQYKRTSHLKLLHVQSYRILINASIRVWLEALMKKKKVQVQQHTSVKWWNTLINHWALKQTTWMWRGERTNSPGPSDAAAVRHAMHNLEMLSGYLVRSVPQRKSRTNLETLELHPSLKQLLRSSLVQTSWIWYGMPISCSTVTASFMVCRSCLPSCLQNCVTRLVCKLGGAAITTHLPSLLSSWVILTNADFSCWK